MSGPLFQFRWFALVSLIIGTLASQAAEPSSAPAALSKEGDLTTLTLKPEAEERLRLKVVPVELRKVAATRLFAGEVVLPLGDNPSQLAPLVGGTLDEVLRLGELQIAADGKVREAMVRVDAAKVALERAERMLASDAGSVRAVDEANADLAVAESALTTSVAQRALLGDNIKTAFEKGRMWVRVSIYVGEVALLDAKSAASVSALTGERSKVVAEPATGPPTANAATSTVDWYYELANSASVRPGEKVVVEIPLRDNDMERLVVPFNSVLHDIHGGEWVYERVAAHTYTRRRIQVAQIAGNDAVLATGPAPRSQIVTDGSAELFGTEFMTGK